MKKTNLTLSRLFAALITCMIIAVVIGYSSVRVRATELHSTSLIDSPDLIAYYQLDNNLIDHEGSYNLSPAVSPASFTLGEYGNAFDLGTSEAQYANVDSDLGIAGGAISISLWVKLNQEIGADDTYTFAVQGDSGSHVKHLIGYQMGSGIRYVMFLRTKDMVANDMITVPIDLGTSDWHHLVLTYSGTTMYGYVDGVKTTALVCSGNGTSGDYDHFTIGAEYEGSSWNLAEASIDDVAVFNRALSDSEVSELSSARLTARKTADSSISAQTSPSPDGQLALRLKKDKSYIIDGALFVTAGNSNPDFKFDIEANSATALAIGYTASDGSTGGNQALSGGIITQSGSTKAIKVEANSPMPVYLFGTITMSTDGDCVLEWAQNTSDATYPVTLKAGSYLRAQEIP